MIASDRSNNSISRFLRGAAWRCLLVAVPLLAISPAAHAGYNLTFVTDPTGTGFINLLGINNSGTVAGFDNSTFNQGFTLTLPSSFSSPILFPPPGTFATMVTGINDAGDVSGIYVTASAVNHGFTEIGGVFKTVDNPASTVFNQALGINNSDETVGYYTLQPSGAPGDVSYSQSGGVFTPVAGLPTNINNQAVGLNNSGEIVGFYQPTTATSLGYLDDGGTITTIDPFGSTFVSANGINDKGDIVGTYLNVNGNTDGFIWTPSDGYTSFSIAGAPTTDINSINNKGDIVGFYVNAAGSNIGFVGSPVPEPSTWAMMLLGFAAFGFLGYRKMRVRTLAA
jgi:hypothetical protein